jgi:hypothetical protein
MWGEETAGGSSHPPTMLQWAPMGRWALASRRSRSEDQMAIDASAARQRWRGVDRVAMRALECPTSR